MTFYESLVESSGRVWPLIANHLWQATLFFLLVLIVSASLKRAPARIHYSLWLVALAKFVLPSSAVAWLIQQAGIDFNSLFASSSDGAPAVMPITPFLSPVASSHAVHYTLQPTTPVTGQNVSNYFSTVEEHSYWYAALTVVWVAGCALFLYLWLKKRRLLSAAIRSGKNSTAGRELQTLQRVQSWLGLHRKVALVISTEITQPGVWRIFKPVIVLPEGMTERLGDTELEAVMMHELIHVERWDNLLSIPQRIVCCLLWFHPLVWLLDRQLLAGREQSCDDAVIRLSGDSQVYASSIKKVCRHSLGWEVSGLSSAAGSDLKKRIKRIVGADINRNTSLLHRAMLCVVAAALIFLSAAAAFINRSETPLESANRGGTAIDERFVMPTFQEPRREAITGVKKETSRTTPPIQYVMGTLQPGKQSSAAPVEIKGQPDTIELDQLRMPARVEQSVSVDKAPNLAGIASPMVAAIRDIFLPVAATTTTTKAQADLSQFVGRYEVDPARAENFILDITLESGRLWLKPSHTARRELLLTGESRLSDVYSDFQFTALEDNKGRVIGLRLDSWSSDIIARKLSLPPPSTNGTTVFRLRGYPNARVVAVAGSFNKWNQSQLLFVREGDEWVCRVNLARGKHQYKFIIDGDWITDPTNTVIVDDGRGNKNSQLIIG